MPAWSADRFIGFSFRTISRTALEEMTRKKTVRCDVLSVTEEGTNMGSRATSNLFWCLDCFSIIALDIHGRCEVCGSDAVDIAVRPPVTVKALEAMFSPKIRQKEKV